MLAQRRILVAEKDRRQADILAALFVQNGYAAKPVYDGRDALEALRKGDFDIVVAALELPHVSGDEIARFVDREMRWVRTIVLAERVTAESAIEAIHHHVFDFLVKPVDFEALQDIVDAAFVKVETDRMRVDMMSMIAHDLKIPLTSVIGYSTILTSPGHTFGQEKVREFSTAILRNGQRILSLIENYLTSCRIEAAGLTLDIKEISIGETISEVFETMKYEAEQRRARFTARVEDNLPRVRADPNLIYRALCNLAGNALKFCDTGTEIVVRAESTLLRGAEAVRIEVANSGEGIDDEELPYVFDRYKRARTTEGIAGTGLGLYVVKSIVLAHGGDVEAASEPGIGAVLSILLPVAGPETAGEGQ